MLLWQRCGNKRAGTGAGFEVAFSEQLGIGVEDREAGNAQFRGEFTAGEDLLAWPKVAVPSTLARSPSWSDKPF